MIHRVSDLLSKITRVARVPLVRLLSPLFLLQLLTGRRQPDSRAGFAMAAPHQGTCWAAVPGPEQFTTDPDFESAVAYLATPLPRRVGERPCTQACLPHAQMSNQSPGRWCDGSTAGRRSSAHPTQGDR